MLDGTRWYRVELNADGSARSCAEVEGRREGAHHVFFVCAKAPEEAIREAKHGLTLWREGMKKLAEAKGLCRDCGRYRRTRTTLCDACATKRAASSTRSKTELGQIKKLPWREREAALKQRAEKIRLERRERALVLQTEITGRAQSSADVCLDAYGLTNYTAACGPLLRWVLRNYDRDPEQFRAWLVGQIETAPRGNKDNRTRSHQAQAAE